MNNSKKITRGAEFLIKEFIPEDIFSPEDFLEEEKIMACTIEDFLEKEVYPHLEKIDTVDPCFVLSLLKKAGELGFLSVNIDEEYGGLGMNFISSLLVVDCISTNGSFSTTFGAHTGIGTLPIYYYGNQKQKAKYIPKLASGQWTACYCLTEPNAGSDANAGKTKATLAEDEKHYLINGQKIWISNASFANILIVFAKIENDKNLTAFIVEKSWKGITIGQEEQKMGIKGSSTCQVFFNNVKVPVENMLSERENGFKIAVNILNVGRIKLGFACISNVKRIISLSTNYANQRKQFNVPISSFGAIKSKIANMISKCYTTESMCYRAGMDIQNNINHLITQGISKNEAKLKSVYQFAMECSIIKVFASECLDYCADQGVQIYGGMGFSEEYPMARAYRDARITRIYEGTNEINRILLAGMLFKKAVKNEIPLFEVAMKVGNELTSIPFFATTDFSDPLSSEMNVIRNLKKSILMVADKAVEKFRENISKEQEILMNIADMLIQVYAGESAVLRAKKEKNTGSPNADLFVKLAQLNLHKVINKVKISGDEAINSFATGDTLKIMLMGLKRFTKTNPVNVKSLKNQIARETIEKNYFPYILYR